MLEFWCSGIIGTAVFCGTLVLHFCWHFDILVLRYFGISLSAALVSGQFGMSIYSVIRNFNTFGFLTLWCLVMLVLWYVVAIRPPWIQVCVIACPGWTHERYDVRMVGMLVCCCLGMSVFGCICSLAVCYGSGTVCEYTYKHRLESPLQFFVSPAPLEWAVSYHMSVDFHWDA